MIKLKIIKLIKSEFIKNYSVKRLLICILVLILASLFITFKTDGLLFNRDNTSNLENSIQSMERSLLRVEEKNNKTFEDNSAIIYYKNYIKYMELIKENTTSSDDWKISLSVYELIPLILNNYSIDTLNNNPNSNELLEICSKSDGNTFENYLISVCGLTDNEKDNLYQKNSKLIIDYENLLKEDKYYLYLQYKVDNNMLSEDDNLEFIQTLIDKKVENSDSFLVKNYIQYQKLETNANLEIMLKKEYEEVYKNKTDYSSYDSYYAYNNNLKNKAIESREILLYSTKNEIKQDIFYTYLDNVSEDNMYINTKLKVNRIFHLSIVVLILVSITNGGIVSNEHSKGTIKNIITAPVKRWKILISKFIYLILDTYILWLIGLIILSLCSGLKFGFNDLLTPKLLYTGGKVIEVNYYLYLIKNILIVSIPVIAFLSILFFLSTVTLNTSLTVGITSIVSVLGFFMWLMQFVNNFKYIVYTPFWYLDCGYILMNADFYQISLSTSAYSLSTGVIVSIIVTIIMLLFTNIIYIKRDIKN